MTPSDTPGDTLRLREIFTRQWHKWNDGRRAPWNGNISKSFDFTLEHLVLCQTGFDSKRCQEMSRVKSNYWKPPEPQNQWSGSESVTSWSSCALRECLEWSSLAAALLLQQCWCLWIWYTWQIDAKQVYELYNREKRHIWTTPLFFWTHIAGSEFCGEKQTRAPSQNLPRCWQRSTPWFQRRLKKPSCSL